MVMYYILYSQTINTDHQYIISVGWDSGSGVRSHATCCRSTDTKVTFQCQSVWSESDLDLKTKTVSCPDADQFMTGCSGGYVHVYILMLIHSLIDSIFSTEI